MRKHKWLLMLTLALLTVLTACGGGGGGGGEDTVSGVAAIGAPFVGTVDLKDASSPAQVQTATINPDGSFSFDVGDLTPPFILKATGAVGTTNLYSFAYNAGTANINPLTNLAIAMASGGLDPATVYDTASAGTIKAIATNLPASVTDIQTRLQPLLTLYANAKAHPFIDAFTANHTGLDEVLDMVAVDVTNGNITITNRFSDGVIVSGQSNDSSKWIFDSAQIPTPQIHPIINPVAATLKVNETVVFKSDVMRSSNKKVTWSVVETAGGTITAAGVYTAPAVAGTYHVMANSDIAAWPVTATVKVIPTSTSSMSVTIDPTSTTVTANGNKTFTATVTGSSNTKVTWSVAEQNGGSITSTGVYTAPATAGTYHVKAVSVADPSKSATATVTVSADNGPPNPIGPYPIGTWVGPNGFKFIISQPIVNGAAIQYSGIVYHSSLSGGSMKVNGTDTMVQILGSSYPSINFTTLSVVGGQNTSSNFTTFEVGLTGSLYSTTLSGLMSISSSNSANNYFNSNAVFKKQ